MMNKLILQRNCSFGTKMLLSVIGVLTLFTACRGSTDEVVVGPEPEPVIVNVSTGYSDLWGEAEETVIQQFEETHPDIRVSVKHQDMSWQSSVAQKVLPDLLFGEIGYDLTQVSRQDSLARLNDLWTQADLFETFPTSLQALSLLDGNQYYLPMVTSWVAIYYNISLFEQYDLTPPQTWDELLQVCDTLQLQGIRPLALGPPDWTGMYWFDYLNLRLNGIEFHRQLLQGQVPFDDARVQRVFDAWRGLLERRCFGDYTRPLGIMDSRLAIVHGEEGVISQGQAAMTLVASWEMHAFSEKFQTEIDFFRFPILDPAVPIAEVVYAYGYAMPRGAEDRNEALEFLAVMSSAEAQTMLAQGLGPTATPARLDVDLAVLHASQLKGLTLLREADEAIIAHVLAVPPAVMGQFEDALDLFVSQPDNINQVLLELEEGRQAAVERGWFK